ncbi:chorismate synthase [Eubacterium sp. 14-2]|uniref:chorismate synthase n=1 Tax=Eubacterium sp. 14-2 TaxID=1235790 RepID=UPI000336BDDF|nr:chorismate synthase [Eubacterium sp. 14-2]EOT27543.1 chorismate synthase [Eubacterium sp. 14-2]
MAGSTFGTHFKITTWGESHGKGIGVVVDGCPAGLPLKEADIQTFLDRRKPGQSRFSTQRQENDKVEILSGVFEGKTTGTPISLMVFNQDQRSRDYGDIASYYRPGHADYTFDMKYGFRDYRGGGRSSGRETIGRVAAGAIAAKILDRLGVSFLTYTRTVGPVSISKTPKELLFENPKQVISRILSNPLYMPEENACTKAQEFLETCMERKDSAGGIIECIITGVPAGIGEPVFDKLDANLAKAIFSIGAVKGFEIGDGFASASVMGSENNDSFEIRNGSPALSSNHAGGILGGISNGAPIIFRAAVKPTPSISTPQNTINKNGEPVEISIHGRHDPVIVPRAVVVVEAMAALAILDLMLEHTGSQMESPEQFYRKD